MFPKSIVFSGAGLQKVFLVAFILLSKGSVMGGQSKEHGSLIEVFSSKEIITGVTTTRDGRIFFEYPHLDGSSGMRIAELHQDGSVSPFPNNEWNSWTPGKPTEHSFVRTNSLRIGPDGLLWVVDTGTAKFGGKILRGGVKLVSVDLQHDKVARIYPLDSFTHSDSFVDDVRFHGRYAFLTDAGRPAIIVLDLTTGEARRVLENDGSTTAQRPVVASGKILHTLSGEEVKIHADQMEVSPDGRYLYYQALTGPMYRIETRYLEDPQLTKGDLTKKASLFAETPSTGGTAIDAKGTIYLSDVESRRILTISPNGDLRVLLEDTRLDWPDAMWIDGDGFLWMPVAQLDKIAPFQGGRSRVEYPIRIYKMRVAEN